MSEPGRMNRISRWNRASLTRAAIMMGAAVIGWTIAVVLFDGIGAESWPTLVGALIGVVILTLINPATRSPSSPTAGRERPRRRPPL